MGLTPQRLIKTFDQEGYSPYHSILSPQRRVSLLVPLPLVSSASLCQNSAHHFPEVFSVWKNCLELRCKTIHQSKEFIKGYLIKIFTFLVLSEAVWGCLITGGNSVRKPFNWLWILGLIVRAPYSNFGEACQHGTMLWPSTYKDGITNDLVNLVGYISSTHAASLNPLSTIVCSASWQQIPHWNHKYYILPYVYTVICIRIACHQKHAIVI